MYGWFIKLASYYKVAWINAAPELSKGLAREGEYNNPQLLQLVVIAVKLTPVIPVGRVLSGCKF